jgi:hypothetical protein
VTVRRTPFALTAWLFLAGVVVQVTLAGMALFDLADWTAHAALGWFLPLVAILVLVCAFVARLDRRTLWLTVALVLTANIQPSLAEARSVAPLVAAVHPVNALVVFWLAVLIARRSLARD